GEVAARAAVAAFVDGELGALDLVQSRLCAPDPAAGVSALAELVLIVEEVLGPELPRLAAALDAIATGSGKLEIAAPALSFATAAQPDEGELEIATDGEDAVEGMEAERARVLDEVAAQYRSPR